MIPQNVIPYHAWPGRDMPTSDLPCKYQLPIACYQNRFEYLFRGHKDHRDHGKSVIPRNVVPSRTWPGRDMPKSHLPCKYQLQMSPESSFVPMVEGITFLRITVFSVIPWMRDPSTQTSVTNVTRIFFSTVPMVEGITFRIP